MVMTLAPIAIEAIEASAVFLDIENIAVSPVPLGSSASSTLRLFNEWVGRRLRTTARNKL
jgi:hypothetical protein